MVFEFNAAADDFGLVVFDSHKQFISQESPEIFITVHNDSPKHLQLGSPRASGDIWSFYETGQDYVLQVNTRSRGLYQHTDTLVFRSLSNQADLYVHQEPAPDNPGLIEVELPPVILDETMATCFLPGRKGLHFHACGVNAWDGHGFLFTGYSGAGKSTLARLWRTSRQALLLSDERVAVRCPMGHYRISGTPWHSSVEDSCSPDQAPLERIFILEHAFQNQARRLKPAAAVAALAARAYLPFWDPQGMALALEFLDELAQTVPCYQLGFVPDASVIDFIKCLND
jgi:hypothetical protein